MNKIFSQFKLNGDECAWNIELNKRAIFVKSQKPHLEEYLNRISNQQLKKFFSRYKYIFTQNIIFHNCNMSNRCLRTLTFLIKKETLKIKYNDLQTDKIYFSKIYLTGNKFNYKHAKKFFKMIQSQYFRDSEISLSYYDDQYYLSCQNFEISFILDQLKFIHVQSNKPFQIIINDDQKKFYEYIVQMLILKANNFKLNFYLNSNKNKKLISCQQRNAVNQINIYLSMEQILSFPFDKYQFIIVCEQELKSQKIVCLKEKYEESYKFEQGKQRFNRIEYIFYQSKKDGLKQTRYKKLKQFYSFESDSHFNCNNQKELNFINKIVLPSLFINSNSNSNIITIKVNEKIVFSIQTKEVKKEESFNKYIIQTNNILINQLALDLFQLISKNEREYNKLLIYSSDFDYTNEFWNEVVNKEMQFKRLQIVLNDYNEDTSIYFSFIEHYIKGIQELSIVSNKGYICDKFMNMNGIFLSNCKNLHLKYQVLQSDGSYYLSDVKKNIFNNVTNISHYNEIIRNKIIKLKRLVNLQSLQYNERNSDEYYLGEFLQKRFYETYSDDTSCPPYGYFDDDDDNTICMHNFCKDKQICQCEELIRQYEMVELHDNKICSITRADECLCNFKQLSKVKILQQYFE